MTTLKNQILQILINKAAKYDHSKIKFEDLLSQLNCTRDELIICINGSQDARIDRGIAY